MDLIVPRGFTEWCTTQTMFRSNTMTKTFASKFFSQGSIEQDNLLKNVKIFVLGNLIKISISVLNFNTESAEKPTI